jgi:hypothetical protein
MTSRKLNLSQFSLIRNLNLRLRLQDQQWSTSNDRYVRPRQCPNS